jgi:phenylalanyl-tRNA synthetase beta chain
MATAKISKREIEKFMKVTPQLIESISLMGIPVESETKDEIEIEVLPNRPDVLSTQGFVRALKAYLEKEPGMKKYKVNNPLKNYDIFIDKSVKEVRPYTACAIIKNLNFNDEKIKEIIEMQEKIHTTLGRNRKRIAIGIYPLEKITLPITFKALNPKDIKFKPLECDKELTAKEILTKTSTGKEYAHLLENSEKYPIFIDSKNKVLSMPPIINSDETGRITESTKEIFIECSGFDFSILNKTLNIIVTTLADMGGEIFSMNLIENKIKQKTPNLEPEKMKISLENVNKLIGLNLKEKDLEKLLPKMEYEYQKGSVSIPPWRTDILHEVDIIEDIAIAYGYNNLTPEIPKIYTIGEETTKNKFINKLTEILIGLKMIEVSSYHLVKEEELKEKEEKIETENSKSEYKLLRPNLTIPTLRILTENKDNEYPQRIFEIGTVFSLDKENSTTTGIKENENLVIAITPGNFTETKQILDCITSSLNIEYSIEESKNCYLIEGRTGSIRVNKKEIGKIGEVHPKILKKWNIRMPVSLIEISLNEIINNQPK